MQAPPQYTAPYGQIPPKKNNVLWIVLGICCLCGCACFPVMAAILFPVFAQARQAAMATMCLSNVKRLNLSAQIYANDWDEKLPSSPKWSDTMKEYALKSTAHEPGQSVPYDSVFHCPSVKDPSEFGYGMNDTYSMKTLSSIKEPENAIVLFESADLGWNAHSPEPNYPVPPRHNRKNIAGYADGHVKSIRS